MPTRFRIPPANPMQRLARKRHRFGVAIVAAAAVALTMGGCPMDGAEPADQTAPQVAGPQGPTGPQGPEGSEGPAGPEAPQGEQGSAGAEGPQGEQGPLGPQGDKGDKGDPGVGDQGSEGGKGDKGDPGAPGNQGVQGPSGEDGQLRIYGDGSDGSHTITADTLLLAFAAANDIRSFQFVNLTINAGVTLTVPSGTIIRCSGTFSNDGILLVRSAAGGGSDGSPAETGIAQAAPTTGINGTAGGADATAGLGGVAGISVFEALWNLDPGFAGGGGGAQAGNGLPGASGGGTILVLAREGIVNTGVIDADARLPVSAGGAGGGVVILASQSSITNASGAEITARGSSGADATSGSAAAGGGGGGGIVRMLAATITNAGTVSVEGGAGGLDRFVVGVSNGTPLFAGGGGGASYGNGGNSGRAISVPGQGGLFDVEYRPGSPGNPGFFESTEVDPTALF